MIYYGQPLLPQRFLRFIFAQIGNRAFHHVAHNILKPHGGFQRVLEMFSQRLDFILKHILTQSICGVTDMYSKIEIIQKGFYQPNEKKHLFPTYRHTNKIIYYSVETNVK